MKTQEKDKTKETKTKSKRRKKTWRGLPAFIKPYDTEEDLSPSILASLIWHIVGLFAIWVISISLAFFGLQNIIFPKPKPKIENIEFNLKTKSKHIINHHKITKIKETESTAFLNPNPKPKKQETNFFKPNPVPKKINSGKGKSNNSAVKSPKKIKSKFIIPAFNTNISDAFSIPVAKIKPMGSSSNSSKNRYSSGTNTDNPSLSSTGGGSESGSLAGRSAFGKSGFDKTTTKKMVSSYDISPYVNELKRNIRWNWKTPKKGENKKVELFLRIARDGRIIILNVKRTSEVGEVDEAALNAVKKTQPLNPLPAKYTKNYLDVIFSFDSNASSLNSRY